MFNTFKYVKKLEEVGITRSQAEAHIQIVSEIMETTLATQQDMKDLGLLLRQDMKDLETKLSGEMKGLETKLSNEMNLLRQDVKQECALSEHRITIKLGTMVSVAIGIAVTLTKLFN